MFSHRFVRIHFEVVAVSAVPYRHLHTLSHYFLYVAAVPASITEMEVGVFGFECLLFSALAPALAFLFLSILFPNFKSNWL